MEDREFSFADMFFYCIKRWFIAAAVALAVAAVFVGFNLDRGVKTDKLQISAAFCDIETYLHNSVVSGDNLALDSVYRNVASRAMRAMASNEVRAEFLGDEQAKARLRLIFNIKVDAKDSAYADAFSANFTVSPSESSIYVTVSGVFDAEGKEAAAKALLNDYMTVARKFAYKDNTLLEKYTDPLDEPVAAIEIHGAAKYLPTGEDVAAADKKSERGLLANIALGLITGVICGAAAVIVIYFADPRLKSFAALGSDAGELIAKTDGDSIDSAAVTRVAALVRDKKVLAAVSPLDGGFCAAFASAVAKTFRDAGVKALFIDFTGAAGIEGAGSVGDYLDGKKLPELLPDSAMPALNSKSPGEWTKLLSKKDRFAELKTHFDKIIIAYSGSYEGGAAVIGGVSDAAVMTVSAKNTKRSDAARTAADLGGRGKVLGTYIYKSL
ncbi:MAG: hypothetical protein LBP26_08045 [Clostridiales bacterium]|nr:hypothetical protein [Clostridiales bacterium]